MQNESDNCASKPLERRVLSSSSAARLMASIESDETGPRHTEYNETDLAYAAGYLDGEGCFQWNGNTVSVTVDNTYPNTLMWLKRMFGGSVGRLNRKDENCRTTYRYRIFGFGAASLSQKVLPYLQEKAEQAKILIKIRSTAPHTELRKQLTAELSKQKRIDRG